MNPSTTECVEADLVSVVDRRRAEGVSVSTACREAGISTSTYYRRRRTSAPLAELAAAAPPTTVGILANGEGRDWPFTARAPFYWDQVFSDELADSFVRREFGRGPAIGVPRGPLAALAATSRWDTVKRFARRVGGYMPRATGAHAPGAITAAALLALVLVVSGWMVSVASDPAAWIDPAQTRIADAAVQPGPPPAP